MGHPIHPDPLVTAPLKGWSSRGRRVSSGTTQVTNPDHGPHGSNGDRLHRLERLPRVRSERVAHPGCLERRSHGGCAHGRWTGAQACSSRDRKDRASVEAPRPRVPVVGLRSGRVDLVRVGVGAGRALPVDRRRRLPRLRAAGGGCAPRVPERADSAVEPGAHRARRPPHRERAPVHELDGGPRPAPRRGRRPAHADDRPRLPTR